MTDQFYPLGEDDSPLVENRTFTTTSAVFDRERFTQSMRMREDPKLLGSFTQDSMRLEVDYDIDFNMWRLRLETEVLKEHIADDYYHTTLERRVPASVWQMFKAEHMHSWWMSWLVDRRPVRHHVWTETVSVKVERSVLYPEANVPRPPLGRPFILEKVNFV